MLKVVCGLALATASAHLRDHFGYWHMVLAIEAEERTGRRRGTMEKVAAGREG